MTRDDQAYLHTEEKLDNGLKLLHLDLPHTHGAALVARVEGGPICETPQNLGISHLLEHLHLSVSPRYASRHEMLRALDDLPGTVDAETGSSAVYFAFDVAPQKLVEASAFLAEILPHRSFSREVIQSEAALLSTELVSMDEYRCAPVERLFKGHAYGQPQGGHSKSFRRLTCEQIEDFDRRMFRPEAMTVGAVGPLGAGRLEAIRENLSSIGSPGGERLTFPEPPKLTLPGIDTFAGRGRMCHSTIAFRMPSPPAAGPYIAMKIAAMGLTRLSSPLYAKLRYSSGIAYAFDTDWTEFPGVHLLWIYGVTMPRNRERFLEEVLKELRSTCTSGTPRPWFEPARLDYLYFVERAMDFPASIARRLVNDPYLFDGQGTLGIPDETRFVRDMTWPGAREVYAEVFRRENVFVCAQKIHRILDGPRFRRHVAGLIEQLA
jgi:predicted Zn-dependent peptidase